MKRSRNAYSLLAVLGCLAVAGAASWAQERGAGQRGDPARPSRTNAAQSEKTGDHLRASVMMGMDIQNRQGDGVGRVNDLVIDADTGKVRYAAVTYGGFLGLGNKMFAVPYEAFSCEVDPEDPDQRLLFLDVTQKQLEGAEGFDEANWPDFADPSFAAELDERYGVEREESRENGRSGVSVDVSRRGVRVGVGS